MPRTPLQLRCCSIVAVACFLAAPASAIEPDWRRSPWFDEISFTADVQPNVRIHVNAPVDQNGEPARATRLIIYTLPNGNTIEQTLGCRMAEGLDWHYDIQHVAAQVRLLRTLASDTGQSPDRPSERIVLICAEADGLSWPNWRRTTPDANRNIAKLVDSWRQEFGTADCRVLLTGHSGGGSFILGVIEGNEELPGYIDRIAFLDANYSFEDALHGQKLARWLDTDASHRLIVLAYDDREIMLDGKKVVGPTGGTYRATGRMRESLSKHFSLTEAKRSPFQETAGLDGRIHFYVHPNPENKILHTVLVGEMNGLAHVATLGTSLETAWGNFGGPRAYEKWVQPEPTPKQTADTDSSSFPPRRPDAESGSQFIQRVESLSLEDREAAILQEILSGNFPEFLRRFETIPIAGKIHVGDDERNVSATLEVMPDYLAVGSDDDFVRIPMTPQTAQKIADAFGCVLPTTKIVDAIDAQAEIHLEPRPLTQEREAAATFFEHHRIIEKQRAGKPLGLLVTGIKKDIVLTPRIFDRPQRLAIYGWRKLDGQPIQPLTIVHWNRYVDYSHGARLVRNRIEIDGRAETVSDLLSDSARSGLVSDEGPMKPPRYPRGE